MLSACMSCFYNLFLHVVEGNNSKQYILNNVQASSLSPAVSFAVGSHVQLQAAG